MRTVKTHWNDFDTIDTNEENENTSKARRRVGVFTAHVSTSRIRKILTGGVFSDQKHLGARLDFSIESTRF